MKTLNISLQSDVQDLKDEKAKALDEISDKNSLVDALKKLVNADAFEELMKKWAEAIDTKKYEDAYKLEYGWMTNEEGKMSLEDYSAQYASNLKSLKLKSVKINTDKGTTASGDLALVLVLEAKLSDNADTSKCPFANGDNKRLVKLKFISDKYGFVIENISSIH